MLVVFVTGGTGAERKALAAEFLVDTDSSVRCADLFRVVIGHPIVIAVPGVPDAGIKPEPVWLLDFLCHGSSGHAQKAYGKRQGDWPQAGAVGTPG
ncbi:hypothetical protein [Marinobacter sp. AN1]|uniref:hypothetical protein n=1 Tax=Marinobacter sp. AN1 TaxID=2886046 RepID=UPI00222E2887|nr:hypothetical protein [Marinobacter sp. AN1]UZD67096.1 hypothetical protein LJ360_07195 [Marinobacter sp. AN1]